MLPIEWNARASDDLLEMVAYIAQENLPAAIKMRERLETVVLQLAQMPYMFPMSSRVKGLRELVAHPNYIILYRVLADKVEIVAIVHARQNLPRI
ncbi:type II toxin-antitoxin system RelE/ParE family toxin [Kingella negevensis]|uniref:type II toxin-antitoxin system RelE/ParE family toxin n=1 Tax=Kingella negevensis TaxID=1522312 RepID=UPI002542CD63|nr:type II toxin-antitoxin system RelE/ParE family toxin [Kingella negevensis]WII92989.1 type II toxin-antitoxin system RelE/ParE family toxin [Kingella negevensis]